MLPLHRAVKRPQGIRCHALKPHDPLIESDLPESEFYFKTIYDVTGQQRPVGLKFMLTGCTFRMFTCTVNSCYNWSWAIQLDHSPGSNIQVIKGKMIY